MMPTVAEARQLAEARSVPEPNTGCWLWLGDVGRKDYARITVNRKSMRVSRLILGLTDRRVQARHTCDTPLCVNPEHLLPGTNSDNVRDAVRRKRHSESRKTHCKRGHSLENAYVFANHNERRCRVCERDARRRASAGSSPKPESGA